jgi:hypothetical protein
MIRSAPPAPFKMAFLVFLIALTVAFAVAQQAPA